jgi:alpha-tubulin suppressor-like RCC1 family protein
MRSRKARSGSAIPWSTCRGSRNYLVVLTPALVAALACGEVVEAPTAPASESAVALAASAALAFRQVSAGDNHTCGLTTEDRAYCWGLNEHGQLGDGSS